MPIRDQAMREAALDATLGPTRAAHMPDSWEVALFIGDPMTGGYEVPATSDVDDGAGGITTVSNGYARAVHSADDWLPASGGLKRTSIAVQFPATLAEYPDTVTHWGLYDPVSGAWGDCAEFREEHDITGAGDGPKVHLTVFYGDDQQG